MINKGFILTRHRKDVLGKIFLEYWLSTENGPVKVVTPEQKEIFFVKEYDKSAIISCFENDDIAFEYKAVSLKDFQQNKIAALYFQTSTSYFDARETLNKNHITCYESDIRLTERFLMERFSYGGIAFSGVQTPRHTRYQTIENTQICSSSYTPSFKVLSLDIECSQFGELYSIGLAAENYQCVLMIGEKQSDSPSWINWVPHEKALLNKFIRLVSEVDPDIFIGWNVVNFDFRTLIKRAEIHSLPLKLGREGEAIKWREKRGEVNQGYVKVPGRIIVDGIDALKTATYQFESFSLESVSQELLGKGKKNG